MSVLNKEEFMNRVQDYVGDDVSDSALDFVADITETYADMEQKMNADVSRLAKEKDDLDAEWRKKYKEAFFNEAREQIVEEHEEDVIRDGRPQSFADLFKDKEG